MWHLYEIMQPLTNVFLLFLIVFCQERWCKEGRTQMQFFQKTKGLFSTKTGSTNKRRGRAGSSKNTLTMKTNKTMKNCDYELLNTMSKLWQDWGKTRLNFSWLWHEGLERILRWTWVNQETKYCGEVISDDVQLWTETGNMSEPNLTGEKNMTWNLKT